MYCFTFSVVWHTTVDTCICAYIVIQCAVQWVLLFIMPHLHLDYNMCSHTLHCHKVHQYVFHYVQPHAESTLLRHVDLGCSRPT
jgi:hypothetical protein